MLLGWWIFLYAFIVFPHQYVVLNVSLTTSTTTSCYGLENILLLAVLGLAAWTSSGGWRRSTRTLLGASLLYAVNSQLLDRAAANSTYYSGSLYDVPLIATIAWMAAAALSSRRMGTEQRRLQPEPAPEENCSPTRHAGHPLAARARRVDRVDRPVSRANRASSAFRACWPRCCCSEPSSSCASILQDQALMALAPGVAPRLRKPEAPADPARAEREARFARQPRSPEPPARSIIR